MKDTEQLVKADWNAGHGEGDGDVREGRVVGKEEDEYTVDTEDVKAKEKDARRNTTVFM